MTKKSCKFPTGLLDFLGDQRSVVAARLLLSLINHDPIENSVLGTVIRREIGYTSFNLSRFDEVLQDLIHCQHEGLGLFNSISYERGAEGLIAWKFNPEAMATLGKRVSVSPECFRSFTSFAALRLYILALMYPGKSTDFKPWHAWVPYFCGGKTRYQAQAYFKRNVIVPATNQLHNLAGILAMAQYQKQDGEIQIAFSFARSPSSKS